MQRFQYKIVVISRFLPWASGAVVVLSISVSGATPAARTPFSHSRRFRCPLRQPSEHISDLPAVFRRLVFRLSLVVSQQRGCGARLSWPRPRRGRGTRHRLHKNTRGRATTSEMRPPMQVYFESSVGGGEGGGERSRGDRRPPTASHAQGTQVAAPNMASLYPRISQRTAHALAVPWVACVGSRWV